MLRLAGRCGQRLGGVPFVLNTVTEAPRAPWWTPSGGGASVNPTAGIVGLLRKHKVDHPWAAQASEYCWRTLSGATIDEHLEALAARQQDDGGWPITWEPPSPAAVYEWRAFVTIKWLGVLANYGRLR